MISSIYSTISGLASYTPPSFTPQEDRSTKGPGNPYLGSGVFENE